MEYLLRKNKLVCNIEMFLPFQLPSFTFHTSFGSSTCCSNNNTQELSYTKDGNIKREKLARKSNSFFQKIITSLSFSK